MERWETDISRLQRLAKWWKRSLLRTKYYALSFRYADRPLAPEQARIVGLRLAGKLYHWVGYQWKCLDELWGHRESSWRYWADNPGSDAYGIPQALPGDKMKSAGPRWWSSVLTQIKWGLKYIFDKFRSPCGAITFHNVNHAY